MPCIDAVLLRIALDVVDVKEIVRGHHQAISIASDIV